MSPDIQLPPNANLAAVAWVFIGLLVVFHMVFIFFFKIGKTGWKIVDYLWLTFATLGIVSAVSQVRIDSANWRIALLQERVKSSFNFAKGLAISEAQDQGIICRIFTWNQEYSPPREKFDQLQMEYNQACMWIKGFVAFLPATSPTRRIEPNVPAVTDVVLKDILRGLKNQFGLFNKRLEDYDSVESQAHHTNAEEQLTYLAPLLLSVALAIRITKVTGELLIDRRERRPKQTTGSI